MRRDGKYLQDLQCDLKDEADLNIMLYLIIMKGSLGHGRQNAVELTEVRQKPRHNWRISL